MKQITTKRFWDCSCKKDYIRYAGEGSCVICGALEEERPDSHINEIPTDMLYGEIKDSSNELRLLIDELNNRR